MSKKSLSRPILRYALSGAAAGMINGLFGAGGGMVLIPMLTRFGRLDTKQAFSSSIYIILPLCLVSLSIYMTQTGFDFQTALPYLLGGLLGGTAGGFLFQKTKADFLHKLLGILILWGGFRLLW